MKDGMRCLVSQFPVGDPDSVAGDLGERPEQPAFLFKDSISIIWKLLVLRERAVNNPNSWKETKGEGEVWRKWRNKYE